MKERRLDFMLKWEIVRKAIPFVNNKYESRLCSMEALENYKLSENTKLLNIRSDLKLLCIHSAIRTFRLRIKLLHFIFLANRLTLVIFRQMLPCKFHYELPNIHFTELLIVILFASIKLGFIIPT